MADEASQPLLTGQARSSSPDPSPGTATFPDEPRRSFELSSESTPLLHRRDDNLATYGTERRLSRSPSTVSRRSTSSESGATKRRSRVRWPTLISLTLLTTGILAILFFAFAAPATVKEYAQEAAVFKPTALSIDSTTPDGVRARIQGDFVMDANRVKNKHMRNFGRFITWIATEVETGESNVDVYLPEYGNILVGNAALPSIKVNIRNGHQNHVDFLADLHAGDIQGIHSIAMDWIEGRLGRLSIRGKATIHLKSGLISMGTQVITDTVTFEENDFPAIPEVNVTKIKVHDAMGGSMIADVLLSAMFDSPIVLTVPSLGFDILVPNCSPGDPSILVANAETAELEIRPGEPTDVSVSGFINKLPDELTTTCPGEDGSPLDFLVSSYIQGLETTIYVRGAESSPSDAPGWLVSLLHSVTIPLPFTGHALDNLVKNFTMSDTHFSLPDPFAEPGTPEAQPTVSALVKVLIALPEQMNFQVEVPHVRALTDVYYKGKKLGMLNIKEWQDANSTQVVDRDGLSALLVEFTMKDAPLQVTDSDLLTQIVQEMLFGSKAVVLHVAATVDAKVSTGLGRFAVRGIPAEGSVPVKTPYGNPLGRFNPEVTSLELGDTTESCLSVSVLLNFMNPTNYSASVPFIDALMLFNNTAVAHIIGRDIFIVPGNNTNVMIDFKWSPLANNHTHGVKAGDNTTVTIRTHEGTFPALPNIGKSLSALQIDVPVPHISIPGSPGNGQGGDDEDQKRPHFIQDATVLSPFYISTNHREVALSSKNAREMQED
ncbi:hypothetical protein N7462_009305 [Penicillium macrosclerotiorum]|uniref:uncharacterized protein n=1 Tax=Penicillium macrosclerotiorum TaxID=303699 RepID=UPI002548C560|nr:uncharacterized protein N7462_009305 [Penicillium macrosclerotiorum]KAJ5673866.1 hypothetical protein N7462_009305 [Penicillium macrosclerotiorum]